MWLVEPEYRSWEMQHIFFWAKSVFGMWEARVGNASWGGVMPPLDEVSCFPVPSRLLVSCLFRTTRFLLCHLKQSCVLCAPMSTLMDVCLVVFYVYVRYACLSRVIGTLFVLCWYVFVHARVRACP